MHIPLSKGEDRNSIWIYEYLNFLVRVELLYLFNLLCTFLFSYLRGKKKEKYEKKKEARKSFLRPTGVLIEQLLRASPHS